MRYPIIGERDGGGWPIFVRERAVAVPFDRIEDVQLVDVDGDGALDLVVNGYVFRNLNADGGPFRFCRKITFPFCPMFMLHRSGYFFLYQPRPEGVRHEK